MGVATRDGERDGEKWHGIGIRPSTRRTVGFTKTQLKKHAAIAERRAYWRWLGACLDAKKKGITPPDPPKWKRRESFK
jgi:hypothetical protein